MPCETTDFTAVGGDSIAAIKVIAHLRALLAPHETLPLLHSHLFRFKTISALADFWRLHAPSSTSCDDSASRQLHHDDAAKSLSSSSDAKSWTDAAAHWELMPIRFEDAFPVTQLQEALLASTLKDKSAYLAEFHWLRWQRRCTMPFGNLAHTRIEAANPAIRFRSLRWRAVPVDPVACILCQSGLPRLRLGQTDAPRNHRRR